MATQMENTTPQFGFTVRGQKFVFDTREEYLDAFDKILDIANEQQRLIETTGEESEEGKYTNC